MKKGYRYKAMVFAIVLGLSFHTADSDASPNAGSAAAINAAKTSETSTSHTAICPVSITGDVNVDGGITSADVISIVNAVFRGSSNWVQPCLAAGDTNCDVQVTSADIIVLVSYVFKGGPAPCDVCTLIPDVWSCP